VNSQGAIILGAHINALGVARSLAARGVRVAIVRTQPFDIAHYSRAVSETENALRMDENPEQLAQLLERRARDWNGWRIVPTNDGALAALGKYRERIEQSYRLIAPSPSAIETLLDKSRMLRAAEQAGIDAPRTYALTEIPHAESGETDLDAMRYPVIMKPLAGYQFWRQFGCKLFVAHNRVELDLCRQRVQVANIPCHLQEYVPGADDAIYAYCVYVDRNGAPSQGLLVHKLRQSPTQFGVARVAEVVEDRFKLRDPSLALLQQIGFRGIAAVEFKIDERDGRPRFIEVNGRSVLYNALLRRSGLDLAAMAWSDHVHGTRENVCITGWSGAWINLHADVLHSVLDRKRDPVTWSRVVAPYQRSVIEATWSASDPKPFLAQWGRTVIEGGAGLFQGRHRTRLSDRTRGGLAQPPVSSLNK
jgi:predicted ATP-grasp superfamily ATP-dependent carboligase